MELSPAGAGLRRSRGFREDHREGRSLAGGRYDLDRAAVGADEFGPIGVHAPLTLIGSSVPSAASNARLQLVARRLRRLGSRHPLGFLLASASQQDDHEPGEHGPDDEGGCGVSNCRRESHRAAWRTRHNG